jgi:N-acetylglutamate synthase-like GNAT family acetyltransferase
MRLRPVEPRTAAWPAFQALLRGAGLPTSDLTEGGARYYALGENERDALAFGGIVPLGDDALVRSVVVPPAGRGRGLGARLVEQLSQLAATWGVRTLWLLTTDAEGFFASQGFETADRAQVPPRVAATPQFQGLCPASAVLMRRALDPQ